MELAVRKTASRTGVYFTTRIKETARTRPALDAATVSVYVPGGVTAGATGDVIPLPGTVRPDPQPARKRKAVANAQRCSGNFRLRRTAHPRGSASTAQIAGGTLPGSCGSTAAADLTPVATFTVTRTLPPPSGTTNGSTEQSAFVGTPAHVRAALPTTAPGESSRRA